MKKKNIILILIVALVGVVAIKFEACTTGKTKFDLNAFSPSSTLTDMESKEASQTKTYIDASGSMKGYFNPLNMDGRFITSISDVDGDQIVWLNKNLQQIKGKPLTLQILNQPFTVADSKFDELLTIMRKDLELDSTNSENLGVLFTDGIISSSSADTRKIPGITIMSFGVLQKDITDALNKNLAVAVYKLKGDYDGIYYNYKNNQDRPKGGNKVNIKNRPYYVIALGKPAQVRHFINNNKLKDVELFDAWGIYDDTTNDGTQYILTPKNIRDWQGNKFNGAGDIEFSMPLPEYVANIPNIENLISIFIDDQDVTNTVKTQFWNNNKGIDISWPSKPGATGIPSLSLPGKKQLIVKFAKPIKDWSKLYCEDDLDIMNDTLQQNTTFGLKYLLDGLKEGVENNNITIFESSISFAR